MFSSLGKGMFANVVRARVLVGEVGEVGKEVAIKIVRHQEPMYVYSPFPRTWGKMLMSLGTEPGSRRFRFSISSGKRILTTRSMWSG